MCTQVRVRYPEYGEDYDEWLPYKHIEPRRGEKTKKKFKPEKPASPWDRAAQAVKSPTRLAGMSLAKSCSHSLLFPVSVCTGSHICCVFS